MPMEINLSLSLPRDISTVPLVRHLCKHALWEIGVVDQCMADVELAVTEACANVVEHATEDDDYEVEISIGTEACEIRVIDTGAGFDVDALEGAPEPAAEGGRGVALMEALVDRIKFISEPEAGTVVHLVKQLEFEGDPPPPFESRRGHLPPSRH